MTIIPHIVNETNRIDVITVLVWRADTKNPFNIWEGEKEVVRKMRNLVLSYISVDRTKRLILKFDISQLIW